MGGKQVSNELKPCPFCGAPPQLHAPDYQDSRWMILCTGKDCPVHPVLKATAERHVLADWNNRPVEAIQVARAEAAEAKVAAVPVSDDLFRMLIELLEDNPVVATNDDDEVCCAYCGAAPGDTARRTVMHLRNPLFHEADCKYVEALTALRRIANAAEAAHE